MTVTDIDSRRFYETTTYSYCNANQKQYIVFKKVIEIA